MKDRILQLMKTQQLNQQAFSNMTGIPAASLSNIFSGRTKPTLMHVEALRKTIPDLSLAWLLSGEGEMFEHQEPAETVPSTPLEQDLFSMAAQEQEPVQTSYTTDKMADIKPKDSIQRPNLGNTGQTAGHSHGRVEIVRNFRDKNETSATCPSLHKITEIRVYFDDQTWESFVPKKN